MVACKRPINPPTSSAAATPMARLPASGQPLVATFATKAANAPASIMPSMPMLMMPVRSQSIPHSAPSTRGTEARNVKFKALTPNSTLNALMSPSAVVLTRMIITTSASAAIIKPMEVPLRSLFLVIAIP